MNGLKRLAYNERLAVFADVTAGRRTVVPVESAVLKVVGLARHLVRYAAQNAVHHRQMLPIVMRLQAKQKTSE